jgi:hypothetical protein
MRTIATLLLVLMAAIYLAKRSAPADWVWAACLSTFAIAGIMWACANWFDVVALFSRPFELPISHTALVPENKRRIGATSNISASKNAGRRPGRAFDLHPVARVWWVTRRRGQAARLAVARTA